MRLVTYLIPNEGRISKGAKIGAEISTLIHPNWPLYETMVFDIVHYDRYIFHKQIWSTTRNDRAQIRYSSIIKAIIGHYKTVRHYKTHYNLRRIFNF